MMPVTPVPQTPDYVKGVINLRGKVIPVVDLRLRFVMDEIDYTERTCIIVVEIEGQAGIVLIGIVVDAVSEVLNIKGEDIEETPTFGTKLNTEYILGMAKMEGGVKILLDIDQILTHQEIESVRAMKKERKDSPKPSETPSEQAIKGGKDNEMEMEKKKDSTTK